VPVASLALADRDQAAVKLRRCDLRPIIRGMGAVADSGIEVESRRIAGIYELRDGRIVRFKAHLDRAEARKAADSTSGPSRG